MSVDKQLLEILACPACKNSLRESGDWLICENASCGLQYPVRNGIPVLLTDEAKKS